ncbi:hypothetical protein WAE31_07185 (plasmid) [Xanthomonas axonopodis pv. vasculorum]
MSEQTHPQCTAQFSHVAAALTSKHARFTLSTPSLRLVRGLIYRAHPSDNLEAV